jgi:hypothetical protein
MRATPCVYRIFDSAWTQRTDGVSSRPDEGSVQADSRRADFALQVESKAGSRNPGPTATDQCASPAGTETTAAQQYRSFSVCLALSLVPLRSWRDCDCQAGDNHSLAPRWVSSVLALAIAQPCWQTEGLEKRSNTAVLWFRYFDSSGSFATEPFYARADQCLLLVQ